MMFPFNGNRLPLSCTSLVIVVLRLLFPVTILRTSVASITYAKRSHPPLESRAQGSSSDCMNPNSQPKLEVSKVICQLDSGITKQVSDIRYRAPTPSGLCSLCMTITALSRTLGREPKWREICTFDCGEQKWQ